MTKQEITQYLTELGQEILSLGRHAEIAIAGGAAMILLVGNREATRDIDAYLGADPMLVREAAKAVAERHALAEDWINDGVKGFFYSTPPQTVALDVPGLRVYSVTPEYLFVMKVMAGRPSDMEDLHALARVLSLTSPAQGQALVARWIPPRLITNRAALVIEELFAE